MRKFVYSAGIVHIFSLSIAMASVVLAPPDAIAQCLDGNCENGTGIFEQEDGVRFVGEFKDGKRHGKGILYFPNDTGHTVGQFKNGELHGFGIDFFPDGGKYEGAFANGRYNGYGLFLHSDGGSYEGEFVDGTYHGRGVYTFPSGRTKDGWWLEGNFVGTEEQMRERLATQEQQETSIPSAPPQADGESSR